MKFRAIFLISLFSLALSACLSLAEDITPPPDYIPPTPVPTLGALFPPAAPDVANGAALYAEKCAPCHGPSGLGDGPQAEMLSVEVPALGRAEFSRLSSPARWFTIVTEGNLTNFMPGFASLNDQERWDVVAYAQSLSITSAEIEAGKALYEANCAQCHGPNGKSAPDADFTNLQWLASRSLDDWAGSVRAGMVPEMPAFEGKLADADIYASLAYVRTFAYTAPVAATSAEQPTPGPDSDPETATQAEGDATPDDPVETDEAIPAAGGQVSGTISSGAGGALPSGLKVVLHGFDHGGDGSFSETVTLEANVGPDGRYVFENVEVTEGRAFYVSLDFAGTEYSSDAAFVQDGQTTFDLPIQVYETTSDSGLLEIGQAHVLLDFANPGKVTIIHFLVIDNLSDKTVIAPGEGQPVVNFTLPQNFENLQFEEGVLGGRFLLTAEGFGDQLSVVPGTGQYQLIFAYDMPYSTPTGFSALFGGGATELSVPLTLAARSVTVLVPEGVTASGAGLTDSGLQPMGGGLSFQTYSAQSLPTGQNLDFKILGSPKTAASAQDPAAGSNQNILIGVGVLGIVLIAAGGYLFWRDRRRAEEEELADDEEDVEEIEEDQPELNEDEILDAIVALDDQFKSGNIVEAAYRERRAELKAQLKKLQ